VKISHTFFADGTERRALRFLVIGSGGNGSAVLFGLPYLHQALVAWGKAEGIEVTVMDGDTVSRINCVRQPFGAADVGHNKAAILVNRTNLFHGFHWRSQESYFSRNAENLVPHYDRTVDFVISCVDTRAARREMHEAFQSRSGHWSRTRYWLDLGNSSSSGQFVLGQPLNDINRQIRTRLRTVTELFPSIMDVSKGEGSLPSCSAAEALERQGPFLNNVLATSALAMLARLLRYGTIDHQGAFYNAEKGRTVPIPIDPDVWEKQVPRRRREMKAN
jgi:PRTRC genetic system ThiF family protein